jgi:putative transposase
LTARLYTFPTASNKELKRRSRVVGAFPNDEALLRLGVAILMDINEEWMTGREYLFMRED